jgi:hypothetical protein
MIIKAKALENEKIHLKTHLNTEKSAKVGKISRLPYLLQVNK